jgi:hypothetical protein
MSCKIFILIYEYLFRWGGKIGEIWASNLKESYLTMQPWLSSYMGISEDEYNRTIKEIVDKELDTHKTYINHHITWATKKPHYKYYWITYLSVFNINLHY